MKRWKYVVLAVVAVLSVALLAGCSLKNATKTPATGSQGTVSKPASGTAAATGTPAPTVTDAQIKTECTAVQKNVVAAIAAYDKANPGSPIDTKGAWKAAMAKLVPKYDRIQPFCPAGGKYSFKDGKPTCSVHGALGN